MLLIDFNAVSAKISEKSITLAKRKISTVVAFTRMEDEKRIEKGYYRELFRKAAHRVVVMFRIYMAIRNYATDKHIFLFFENNESKLYRKFLNTWNNYWKDQRRCLATNDNSSKLRKVYFAKTKKYVACQENDTENDDLMTAVKRFRERRKNESIGKWMA